MVLIDLKDAQCLYDKCKQDFGEIYDNITEGISIKSSGMKKVRNPLNFS